VILIDAKTGTEILPETFVETFRGERVKYISITRNPGVSSAGSTGRVLVETADGDMREYFPSVIGGKIVHATGTVHIVIEYVDGGVAHWNLYPDDPKIDEIEAILGDPDQQKL
jgi:hypothetical protein